MSYVRGKFARAACDLLDWLSEHGIKHGGVQQPSKHDRRLVVWEMRRDDIRLLPSDFADFPVYGTTKRVDAKRVICCWGNHGRFQKRDKAVLKLLDGLDLFCFGTNKNGTPKHPLYLASTAKLVPFLANA